LLTILLPLLDHVSTLHLQIQQMGIYLGIKQDEDPYI
jgi:hypothetical protein